MTDRPEPPGDWLRLDPRMLLVHPVQELRRFLPALVGVVVLGASGGLFWPAMAAVVVPVAVGLARYLTTGYRVGGGRIELKRGLVRRQLLSTPLDRVRTVDLTATMVHRLLGLTTMTIGTGSAVTDAGDRLEIDALAAEEAATLRDRLLRAAHPTTAPEDLTEAGADVARGAGAGVVVPPETAAPVASFEPRWLWYAPFTSTGLVIAGGIAGAVGQVVGEYDVRARVPDDGLSAPSAALVAAAVVGLLLVTVVLSVVGYLVTNWGLRLRRLPGSWHLRRGLLTTRETSIDVDRLAGVAIGEQAGLRLARGRRLTAIVTGLDRSERGSEVLVPPAPAPVVTAAAAEVLGSAAPVEAPLLAHGPVAVRRRFARTLVPAGAAAAAVVALVVLGGWSPWLLALALALVAGGVALAADRARALGHTLVAGHLVARSGSLLRRREMLATEHVIGWTFRDTWFQRRAGLTTLTATTAGGPGAVRLLDVPAGDAVDLADAAVPGLVAQFRR